MSRALRTLRARRLSILAVLIGALAAVTGAWAYFASTGNATASASVGTLAAPSITSATSGAGTTTLAWSPVSPPAGTVAVGYYVQRDNGAPAGNCPTSAATATPGTSCTDSGLPAGQHSYKVIAVWQSWTAMSTTSTATLASGAPTSISVVSGSGQSATVNTAYATRLTAIVTDADGKPVAGVSVTFTAPANGAGATFASQGCTASSATSCTVTTDSSGDATSSALTANTSAGAYTIAATAASVSGATSFSATNTPGAPASVATVSGAGQSASVNTAFTSALTAKVTDQYGNPVPATTVTFTAPTTGASGSFANTTNTTTASTGSDGHATASRFTANTKSGAYTVTATAGSATPASFSLINNPGPASQLIFSAQPSTAASAATISPAVQVSVEDAYGNVETADDATTVTAAIADNPGSGTLSGSTTQTARGGVATFSNLSIDKVGTAYTLTATSNPAHGTATSTPFNITLGAASQLVFTQQPSGTASAATIAPAVKVAVEDAGGNVETGDNATTITLAIGTNPSSGTLSGTTTGTAQNGVATFTNLSIDNAGTGYTLTATSNPARATATSSAFNVGAAKLVFTTQPSGGARGTAFPTQPTVTAEDVNGHAVTAYTATVSLSIKGATSAALSACSASASNGASTFSGCQIDKTGSYQLTATDGSLSVDSSAFSVVPRAPISVALANGGGAGNAYIDAANKTSVNIDVALDSTSVSSDSVTLTVTDAGAAHATSASLAAPVGAGTLHFTGLNLSTLNDGTITMSARVKDSTGALLSSATSATATKDTVAPDAPSSVSLTNGGGTGNAYINAANKSALAFNVGWAPGANNSSTDTITVALTSTGGGTAASGTASRGAGSPTSVSGLGAAGLGDGTVTATATATDVAGNVSATATTSITKDTVAPGAPTGTYADRSGSTSDRITGSAQANATITATETAGPNPGSVFSATATALGSYTLNVDAIHGSSSKPVSYSYSVTATDAAGNVSAPTTVSGADNS